MANRCENSSIGLTQGGWGQVGGDGSDETRLVKAGSGEEGEVWLAGDQVRVQGQGDCLRVTQCDQFRVDASTQFRVDSPFSAPIRFPHSVSPDGITYNSIMWNAVIGLTP